jgi:hypothetical protein
MRSLGRCRRPGELPCRTARPASAHPDGIAAWPVGTPGAVGTHAAHDTGEPTRKRRNRTEDADLRGAP